MTQNKNSTTVYIPVNGRNYTAYVTISPNADALVKVSNVTIVFEDSEITTLHFPVLADTSFDLIFEVAIELATDEIMQHLIVEVADTITEPVLIQLLGQARAGKDFTAAELKSYYESKGLSVELKSYAAPMKRIAASLFGISLEQLDDFKNRSSDVSIEVYDNCNILDRTTPSFQLESNFRTFLQRLGNDAVKPEFGDSVWADLMKSNVSQSKADVIIITDCRFFVEANTFPEAVLVRVLNNSLAPPMQHASELELADLPVHFILDNTDYKATGEDIAALAELILPTAV